MATVIAIEEKVEIPLPMSLADFRRWAQSDQFPETGRIDYIVGRIEVDMSPGDIHSHGKVKTLLVVRLGARVLRLGLGELYTDRARVSCPDSGLSVEPDLVFVSEASLDSGRVKLVPRAGGDPDSYGEFEGAPDLIIEIVSDSSVGKDTRRLPEAYYQSGVSEFWLVDARRNRLVFQVQVRGEGAFVPTRTDAEGFQNSPVLNCWYRLERGRNASGRVTFDLLERELSPGA